MMTNGDPQGRIFYPILAQVMNYFFLLTIDCLLKNKLPEVPEYDEMHYYMMTSF